MTVPVSPEPDQPKVSARPEAEVTVSHDAAVAGHSPEPGEGESLFRVSVAPFGSAIEVSWPAEL